MSEYCQIELTQGQVALVSPEDYEELSKFKWYAWLSPSNNSFYALRNTPRVDGVKTTVLMHRQIMGFPEGLQVDHINGDTLDNRRHNLRIATHTQNMRNSKFRSHNTSGFKGVHLRKDTNRWTATIGIGKGKQKRLGCFSTAEAAEAAYQEAAARYFGEFRRMG